MTDTKQERPISIREYEDGSVESVYSTRIEREYPNDTVLLTIFPDGPEPYSMVIFKKDIVGE